MRAMEDERFARSIRFLMNSVHLVSFHMTIISRNRLRLLMVRTSEGPETVGWLLHRPRAAAEFCPSVAHTMEYNAVLGPEIIHLIAARASRSRIPKIGLA